MFHTCGENRVYENILTLRLDHLELFVDMGREAY